LLVTAYGIYGFIKSGPSDAINFWKERQSAFLLIFVLSIIDIMLDYICWAWTFSFWGIKVRSRRGLAIFISAYAGLLMPVKMGNLLRPDGISRSGLGGFTESLEAEATVIVMDAMAALLIIACSAAQIINPKTTLPACLLVSAGMYLFLNFSDRLPLIKKAGLPPQIRGGWQSIILILIKSASWAAHGFALYFVLRGCPAGINAVHSMLIGTLSPLLGVSTGIPGGIGATESLLGISLSLEKLPANFIALAVTAFRLISFWIWIPAGWITLSLLNRKIKLRGQQ